MSTATAQLADRLAWKRARIAQVTALVFIATQMGSIHDETPLGHPPVIDLVIWLCWAAVLLALLATGGMLLRSKRLRAVLNDETTRDHRLRAMAWGFWSAIFVALAIYVISFFSEVSGREGVRLVITFGIALALIRFGALEKKALKSA